MRKVMMLSIILLLGSMVSAGVVLDDFTGEDGINYGAFRGIGWQAPDTLVNTTNTRGGQLVISGYNVDASELGWDDSPNVPMTITLKPAADNTLLGLGQIMVADDLDRRWMFYFDDFADPTSDEWETIISTSSLRKADEGLGTGEFNWAAVSAAWIQCWTQQGNNNPQLITNVQFDVMILGDATAVRGAAHTPVPTGDNPVDSTTLSNTVSWYSPEQDADGIVVGDPNIVSVDSYDVWWSVGVEPNYVTDTPTNQLAPDKNYSPTTPITFETTYFWRVDTYVTWDSNDFTGTASLSSIVEGRQWEFTTIPEYIAPVLTFDNVHTTVDLLPAVLSATVTGNSDPLNAPIFTLLDDDIDFPAGAVASVTNTTADNQSPTATLATDMAGLYKVKLVVSDTSGAPNGTVEATVEVNVYADACQAAKDAPDGYTQLEFDLDNDCIVGLSDFAVLALEWLTDVLLDAQQDYTGTVLYVPQAVYDARIDAVLDIMEPNSLHISHPPISDANGIRIEYTRPNATDSTNLGSAGTTNGTLAYVEYEITIAAGTYDVYAGYSLAGSGSSEMTIGTEAEPAKYGTLNMPATGSWNAFDGQYVGEVTFDTGGTQTIRTTYINGFNLDWFGFDPQ